LDISRTDDHFFLERSDTLDRMTKTSYRIVLDDRRFSQEAQRRGWGNNLAAAKALGLAESTIWKLRSGKISPSAVTIDRLLSELDLPYSALFHREAS
jgi:transcriptional regulator with XRE-family HTH domain